MPGKYAVGAPYFSGAVIDEIFVYVATRHSPHLHHTCQSEKWLLSLAFNSYSIERVIHSSTIYLHFSVFFVQMAENKVHHSEEMAEEKGQHSVTNSVEVMAIHAESKEGQTTERPQQKTGRGMSPYKVKWMIYFYHMREQRMHFMCDKHGPRAAVLAEVLRRNMVKHDYEYDAEFERWLSITPLTMADVEDFEATDDDK